AVLNISGLSTIATMDASTNPNTVNYTGAGQTVNSNDFDNLILSGSGTVTLQGGTANIGGNFTIGGSVSTSAVTDLSIVGNMSIGVGTSFTSGSFTHTIAGDWTNGGTFDGTGSTINFNGSGQNITGGATTFNELILSGTGTKTLGLSAAITGTLSIETGAIAGLDNANTYTSNLLALAGPIQAAGTWGSTSSAPPAANQNDTFFSGTGLITVASTANNFFSIASGSWSLNTNWSNAGFGGAPAASTPGPGDYVFIGSNSGARLVSINSAISCEAITFDEGQDADNTLVLIPGGDLTVAGAVTIPRKSFASRTNRLVVGSHTVTAGSLDFAGAGSGNQEIDISTGVVTISGNITGVGASSTVIFSGAGLLQVGGTFFAGSSGTLTAGTGTVEYNGAAQTIEVFSYNNLTLSGSGTKTPAGNLTVGAALNVGGGTTLDVSGVTFAVTGTTTIDGAFTITNNPGTKTFGGLITVNGSWNNTNENVTVQGGGITNNGTFNAGTGTYIFNSTSQDLNGTFTMNNVTVNGGANVLTNNGSLTVNNALSGSGTLAQGAGAVLSLGGASAITNLSANVANNTVNFTGSAQTINNNNYFNLTLSGTGAKTLQTGTTAIGGDLTLSGTASATAVIGLSIGGGINIGAGSTLTAGLFDHSIGGNWINDGTFTNSNGRITFSGSTTQSIQGTSPTTFFNLHVGQGAASPDVQLDQTAGVNLVGELTLDNDALFDADGPGNNQVFTVISTVSGDGRIGSLGGSADVTGNVTVQRYMDAEGLVYRYISTPVDNPTAEDLQGEIPITGPFTGSSFPPQTGCTNCAPCTGCVLNNTSMYLYDETIVAPLNNRYAPFPSAGGVNTETMIPGRGYAVYVRNDVSPTTWNLRAPINTGEVDLNPSITGSNDGFNLVGNPYPSPIDWESGAWTRNGGIDPTIYWWDNAINNYASYTLGGGSTNGGSRYIAHGQAFWVLASGTPDLRAQEGVKANLASISQATFFRTAQPDQVRIRILAKNSSDELLVKANQKGTTIGYDARIDAFEFPSDTLLSLHAITEDRKRLAVNQVGVVPESGVEINVGLSGTTPGSYILDFIEFENFTTPTSVYLYDRFEDILREILPGEKEYSFLVTNDPLSGGERFVLYLNPAGKEPGLEKFEEDMVSVYPNPTSDRVFVRVHSTAAVSASLYSSIGTQIFDKEELEMSGAQRIGQFDLSSLPAGVYIIQIQSENGLLNKRIIKQ
ncbi:MAG: T9SS type A sorting domain-containing protein, partial [Cyclobacteriaceae bacterium]